MLYFNKQGFKDYLRGKNYPPKYAGYIDTIYKKILKPNNLQLLFKDLEKCLGKDFDKAIDGLSTISNFITRTYSISKQPKIGVKAKKFIFCHEMSLRSFNDYATGLNKYIEYLKSIKECINRNCTYKVSQWNKDCNKLNLLFYDNISSNGIDSLMCCFSNNEVFIKYVIENSFFFSTNMAKERFTTIVENIKGNSPVPARKSGDKQKSENGTDYFICENENKNQIKITIDSDGNKAVRDLIKNETGYTLSSGEDSLFTNYIISHIWGDAFDPRNFTNFWNLAIVPAWANSLLDKTNSKDLLTKQLINTFKAVCFKKYNLKRNTYYKWSDIFMGRPQFDDDYVLKGDYEIYIINKRKSDKEYGIIKKQKITI